MKGCLNMIFEEDILIHRDFEKEGSEIFDIKKYKNTLRNRIKFTYKKEFKDMPDELKDESRYLFEKGFIHDGRKYFINIWNDYDDIQKIDSFHFKFFKGLTNDLMIELRNFILDIGKRSNCFQFKYNDTIIFILFNKKWKYLHNYVYQFLTLNGLNGEEK
jgi:hypothetical protein